jgi:hypothetical protein
VAQTEARAMPDTPISLSDNQLSTVMAACEHLQPPDRYVAKLRRAGIAMRRKQPKINRG